MTIFQKDVIDFATANSQGATIPYINWDGVLSTKSYVLPSNDLVEAYTRLISPMLTLAQSLAFQIEILAMNRNLLLPKLISGKIEA